MIDTMPNLTNVPIAAQCHHIELPAMCPVSGNPQPGSYIAVRYVPAGAFLEVYALERYLTNYVGGWLRGDRHIRDMEQVVQTIAQDCAQALGVRVAVRAHLSLDCGRMTVRAVAS